MDVYSHLLTERIIYLGTAIDAGVANALIAQLLYLESASPGSDIEFFINCEGGDPSAMLAVHDTMRFIRAEVATTCVGQERYCWRRGRGANVLPCPIRESSCTSPPAKVSVGQSRISFFRRRKW